MCRPNRTICIGRLWCATIVPRVRTTTSLTNKAFGDKSTNAAVNLVARLIQWNMTYCTLHKHIFITDTVVVRDGYNKIYWNAIRRTVNIPGVCDLNGSLQCEWRESTVVRHNHLSPPSAGIRTFYLDFYASTSSREFLTRYAPCPAVFHPAKASLRVTKSLVI